MKKSLFITLSIFICELLPAQTWTWDSLLSQQTDPYFLSKDHNSNIYKYAHNEVYKLNAGGQSIWSITLPANLHVTGLAVNQTSDVFLAGDFTGSFTLGSSGYSGQQGDIWVARFSQNGALQWVKTIASAGTDYAGELCMNGKDLVLTGVIQDTVDFMGQTIGKPRNSDAFIAVFTDAGTLKHIKFAKPDASVTGPYFPQSTGEEVITDGWGNIYLYMSCQGKTTIDQSVLGADMYLYYFALIKLNATLQTVQTTVFGNGCGWYCYGLRDLLVNSKGECMLLRNFYYSQSGNDDESTAFVKVNGQGAVDTTITLADKGTIQDMDIDDCDNLYFTGYRRNSYYDEPFISYLTSFQLSPALALNWERHDTTGNVGGGARHILALDYNDCFVGGMFTDTLKLKNTIYDPAGQPGSFFAKLSAPVSQGCKVVTSAAQAKIMKGSLQVFPNPCRDQVTIHSPAEQTIIIVDLVGRTVGALKMQPGQNTVNLRIPAGVYFVTGSDNRTGVTKLVVE